MSSRVGHLEDVAFEKQLPDFNAKLWKGLHSQWRARKFCDLKVVTANGIVPMHACVWSAFSTDMANLVREEKCSASQLKLSVTLQVNSEVVLHIAHALYTGTFKPPKRLLAQLYSTVAFLGFSDLLELMSEYCKSNCLDFSAETQRSNRHLEVVEEFGFRDDVTRLASTSHEDTCTGLPVHQRYNTAFEGKRFRTHLNRIKQPVKDPNIHLYKWSTLLKIESFAPKIETPTLSKPGADCETSENGESLTSEGTAGRERIKKEIEEETDLEPKVFVCNLPPCDTLNSMHSWSKTRTRICHLNSRTRLWSKGRRTARFDYIAGSFNKKAPAKKTKCTKDLCSGKSVNSSHSVKSTGSCTARGKPTCSHVTEQRPRAVHRKTSNLTAFSERSTGSSNHTSTNNLRANEHISASENNSTALGIISIEPGSSSCTAESVNTLESVGFNMPTPNMFSPETELVGSPLNAVASSHGSQSTLNHSQSSVHSKQGSKSSNERTSCGGERTPSNVGDARSMAGSEQIVSESQTLNHELQTQPPAESYESGDDVVLITMCLIGLQKDHPYAASNSGSDMVREIKEEIDANASNERESHAKLEPDKDIKKEVIDFEGVNNADTSIASRGHSKTNVSSMKSAELNAMEEGIGPMPNKESGRRVTDTTQVTQTNTQQGGGSDPLREKSRLHKLAASTCPSSVLKGTAAQAPIETDERKKSQNVSEPPTSHTRETNDVLRSPDSLTLQRLSTKATPEVQNTVTECGVNDIETGTISGNDGSHTHLETVTLQDNVTGDGRLLLPAEFAEMASLLPVEPEAESGSVCNSLRKNTSEKNSSAASQGAKPEISLRTCSVSLERLTVSEKRHTTTSTQKDSSAQTENFIQTVTQVSSPPDQSKDDHTEIVESTSKLRQQRTSRLSLKSKFAKSRKIKSTASVRKSTKSKTDTSKSKIEVNSVSCVENAELPLPESPESNSRPKRKRMLSSRLAGCKLFGDLSLLQNTIESETSPKRRRTRARSPTPSLSPPSSPCSDDASSSDSWSQTSGESDDEEIDKDADEVDVPKPLHEDDENSQSLASGAVAESPDGDERVAVSVEAVSEGVAEMLSQSDVVECNTDSVAPTLFQEVRPLNFRCPECPRVFLKKESLTNHMNNVHNASPISLQCSYCGHLAHRASDLVKHSIQLHNDKLPFKCPHRGCCYSAPRRSSVVAHMDIHLTAPTVTCSKCKRGFKSTKLLQLHQQSCFDLKKFICDVCGKRFNIYTSMIKHRLSIHGDVRSHLCTYCGKRFHSNGNLKRHVRIHKNSFPYPCKLCPSKFRHSNSLKAHMEAKHGRRNFKATRAKVNDCS